MARIKDCKAGGLGDLGLPWTSVAQKRRLRKVQAGLTKIVLPVTVPHGEDRAPRCQHHTA